MTGENEKYSVRPDGIEGDICSQYIFISTKILS